MKGSPPDWKGVRLFALAAFMVALLAYLAVLSRMDGTKSFLLRDAVVVKGSVEQSAATRTLDDAAADLTNIIFQITGRAVPIYTDGSAPEGAVAFYLGDTAAARRAGVTGEGLRLGDWRMKSGRDGVFLFGRTSASVCAAVFDFADRYLDYHVFTPDAGDVFTPDANAAVPVCDRTVKPAIYSREIYHAQYDAVRNPVTKPLWARCCRALASSENPSLEGECRISRTPGKSCHSSFQYLPPEKYFKDHPEWYSMGPDGKRRGVRNQQSQLCYSNPEVYQHVLDALLAFVEADRAKNPEDPPLVYDFTQQDNSSFLCLCPECKKIIAKYNRVEGGHREGGDAGLQLEFVNRLARDVRAKYPDVQIRTFAYVSTERAPEKGKITVEPNVRIWWCDVYSKSDHTVPLQTPGHYNAEQLKELDEWAALTSNIEVWDYLMYDFSGPELAPDAIKSDAALFARFGVKSIMMETEFSPGKPFYGLNYTLMAKLYVDPTRDVEKIIREFSRTYGDAADEMYDAISFLRREILERPAPTKGEWHMRMLPWAQDDETMERFEALLEKAYHKETREVYRARIVPALAATWLTLLKEFRKIPSAAEKYARAQKWYRYFAMEAARISFMEPSRRAKAEKGVAEFLDLLTMTFDDLPDELKGVPREELVLVDHHASHSRKLDLPRAPRGKAVVAGKVGEKIACGVYDRPSKKSNDIRAINASELTAEGFTWLKLGTCHVGLDTIFWFPGDWSCDFSLKDFHILDDGMEASPNWYELWVSASYARERHPGAKHGALFIDRLTLRRVPPPEKK